MVNVLISFSFSFRFISICSLKFVLKWSGGFSCVNTFSKVDVSVSIFCSVVVGLILLLSLSCVIVGNVGYGCLVLIFS